MPSVAAKFHSDRGVSNPTFALGTQIQLHDVPFLKAFFVIVGRRVVSGHIVDGNACRECRSQTATTHKALDLLSDIQKKDSVAGEFNGELPRFPRNDPGTTKGFASGRVHGPTLPWGGRLDGGSSPA